MQHLRTPGSLWAVAPSLTALVIIQVPASAAYVTIQVAAPEVARATGLAVELIGVFTALSYLGATVGGTLAMPLIGRLGAFRACQVALVACGLALATTTLGVAWAFVLGALFLGVAHGPVTPLGSHVLAGRTPAAIRSSVFSIKQAAVPLGGVLAGLLVTAIAVAEGWQAAVLTMAALCVAAALVIRPFRAHLDDRERPGSGGSPSRGMMVAVRLVLDDRPVLELVIAGCIFGAAQWCFTAFYVAFLVDGRGIALVTAGLGFSVGQAAGVGGRILWGAVADRSGRPVAVLAGLGIAMGLASMAVALTMADWPVLLILAVAAASGLTAIGWNGVLIAELARRAPGGQVAAVTGGFVALFAVSTITFPLAFAGLALVAGYEAGFVAVGLSCLYAGVRLHRAVADDQP